MQGSLLQRSQLEQLLHTRHYWSLRRMDGGEAWLTGQIKVEMNARREALIQLSRRFYRPLTLERGVLADGRAE